MTKLTALEVHMVTSTLRREATDIGREARTAAEHEQTRLRLQAPRPLGAGKLNRRSRGSHSHA